MSSSPRPLSFPAILNMNAGFLGIQFGWGLQMANMSPIYSYLGAPDDQIARLWIAAPLTGFLVQPIIGAMSDRTWGPLGRRRPYFLVGAILSSIALVLMPNAGHLAAWLTPSIPAFYMAAALLWILDASINVSMEPFRAFVADKLPEEQRGMGFATQSFFIGVGAVVAGMLPYLLRNWFHVGTVADTANALPPNVKISFYLGAAAFLTAVLWTIFTTKENPPDALDAFRLGPRISPGSTTYLIDELRGHQVMASVGVRARARLMKVVAGPLVAQPDWCDLRATLIAWCESGFNLVRTAETLHIHRNTLIYRLQKIERLTATPWRDHRASLTLYLACLADQLD